MPVFYPIIEKVLDPELQEKTATENGEVTADEGYDGLAKVTVAVPTGSGGGELTASMNYKSGLAWHMSASVNAETLTASMIKEG